MTHLKDNQERLKNIWKPTHHKKGYLKGDSCYIMDNNKSLEAYEG